MRDPRRPAARSAVWVGFGLVHGWLAWLGVVVLPVRAFYDVDLYRYWATLALDAGRWPVLDEPWVYPAGALVPVLAPALTGARSTEAYAVGWCVLVTVLDAVAVAVLLRAGRSRSRGRERTTAGVWWWLAFLVLLGPIAMGRLEGVIAPLTVIALVAATSRPRVAAVLLTAGAWIKVAPGVLLLPLLAVTRRPVRAVVLPAAAVCVVVVGAVAAGGGLSRLGGFLTEQNRRGLQVEAVASTPWVVAATTDERVRIAFDDDLVTWEVSGPGTAIAARVLGVLLPVAAAALAVLLVRGGADRADVLLWGALAAATLLIVVNKVGSPQFVAWLAPPVAVALTVAPDRRDWRPVAVGVLAIAGLTQVVFPLGADGVVTGDPFFTIVLVLRNVALVVLLATAVRRIAVPRADRPAVSPAAA